MMRRILIFSILLSGLSLHAAPSDDPSAKQREQLRSALLQVRKLQIDMANAQASQAAAEAKVADLNTKVDSLGKRNEQLIKQTSSDKVTYEQTIASLNNKLTDRDKRITQYSEALENWKTGYQQAADAARAKEQECATLLVDNTELKRTVADRESKNIALFNVSTEILDHFENYSLGKALTAREPFIRKNRVTLENLVQDFKGKILDNRIGAVKPTP